MNSISKFINDATNSISQVATRGIDQVKKKLGGIQEEANEKKGTFFASSSLPTVQKNTEKKISAPHTNTRDVETKKTSFAASSTLGRGLQKASTKTKEFFSSAKEAIFGPSKETPKGAEVKTKVAETRGPVVAANSNVYDPFSDHSVEDIKNVIKGINYTLSMKTNPETKKVDVEKDVIQGAFNELDNMITNLDRQSTPENQNEIADLKEKIKELRDKFNNILQNMTPSTSAAHVPPAPSPAVDSSLSSSRKSTVYTPVPELTSDVSEARLDALLEELGETSDTSAGSQMGVDNKAKGSPEGALDDLLEELDKAEQKSADPNPGASATPSAPNGLDDLWTEQQKETNIKIPETETGSAGLTELEALLKTLKNK